MKKLMYLGIALLLFGLAACSQSDPTEDPILGYSLDQFVSADSVRALVDPAADPTDDFRALFAYEIVSAVDGFSPRQSVNAGYDLPWETYIAGYIVPSDDRRTWFPTSNLPGAFRVRDAGPVRIYRKVDISTGSRTDKMVELHGLSKYPTANWIGGTEDAIKLSDLLAGVAVFDSVALVAADGYTKYYQPAQIVEGYYLLSSEVTTFPALNDGLPNSVKKFKKLSSVEVFGATEQVWDFELAPQASANLEFSIPANLSGYESTELSSE